MTGTALITASLHPRRRIDKHPLLPYTLASLNRDTRPKACGSPAGHPRRAFGPFRYFDEEAEKFGPISY